MDYEILSKDDFDDVVTGEMTHYALWNEKWLDGLIAVYFISDLTKQSDFRRLILERDGLGAQDKIEIIRAMIPLFNISEAEVVRFKNITKTNRRV